MKILVTSGFLGAGKTTFIKELIRRTGKNVVVMENEYGEVNLDSQEISQTSDVKILEFAEGCICYSMKDSFASSLLTVSSSLDPEYLVVEPTGIGKLSSILATAQKYEYERISLLRPVTIVTPRSFYRYRREHPDIYLDQIENSSRIVFSKGENESADVLEEIAAEIRRINPRAELVCRHYTQQDDSWWNGLLEEERAAECSTRNTPAESADRASKIHECTFAEARLCNPADLIVLLEDVIRGELGDISRAKGILQCGGEWLRFDAADSRYCVTSAEGYAQETQCVFIGRTVKRRALFDRLNAEPHDTVEA